MVTRPTVTLTDSFVSLFTPGPVSCTSCPTLAAVNTVYKPTLCTPPKMLSNVQQKISCIYEAKIIQQPTSKRAHQAYSVVAGDTLSAAALEGGLETAHPSEKLDGTCVFISTFRDKPWLWVRHDRKPNKTADRRFKKFQAGKLKGNKDDRPDGDVPVEVSQVPVDLAESSETPNNFQWSIAEFKEAPDNWMPASGVVIKDGVPQADGNGHILGWVPLDPNFRGHCWHMATIDLNAGVALILQPVTDPEQSSGDAPDRLHLSVAVKPLSELIGVTMELIGTNVNANPYSLGNKRNPVHFLVRHGIIPFSEKPPLDYTSVRKWFMDQEEGQVEGIVWHGDNGKLLKLHRHHLQLKWPVAKPRLTTLTVTVSIFDTHPSGSLLDKLKRFNGRTFQSISEIQYD